MKLKIKVVEKFRNNFPIEMHFFFVFFFSLIIYSCKYNKEDLKLNSLRQVNNITQLGNFNLSIPKDFIMPSLK